MYPHDRTAQPIRPLVRPDTHSRDAVPWSSRLDLAVLLRSLRSALASNGGWSALGSPRGEDPRQVSGMKKYLDECGPVTYAFISLCCFIGVIWQAFYA